jgi:hypothetical protein
LFVFAVVVWYLAPKKGGKLALREKAEVIADLSSLNMVGLQYRLCKPAEKRDPGEALVLYL